MPALPDRRTMLRVGLATAVPAAVVAATAVPAAAHTPALRERDVTRWMTAYLKAWQTKDADAVVRLFTPDAEYQSVPSVPDQMFRGSRQIHDYWVGVTAPQTGMSGIQGTPIVSGNRAAIEIWVTMQVPSDTDGTMGWVTLIETNILDFATPTLCSRNIEYSRIMTGKIAPPAGWGRR
ncbi:nuclear transport factor 2 family protein [Kitasatospora acidiphila]|uniref:Nuclear transport factor 2 family protein n=1 Tax=Kitasatospora acidiphila TaxID=2567942 RepID=A0A540W783_9ACTN|nr:nuclear transport factor 2 family protein [Kitasatospora acidiphila]TQF04817.1 nuclear transport factor 2 family protein [Kitasatospora acidiphila]